LLSRRLLEAHCGHDRIMISLEVARQANERPAGWRAASLPEWGAGFRPRSAPTFPPPTPGHL
jgi:hypothetical protein